MYFLVLEHDFLYLKITADRSVGQFILALNTQQSLIYLVMQLIIVNYFMGLEEKKKGSQQEIRILKC